MRKRFKYQFQGQGIIPSTLNFRLKIWQEVIWPKIYDNWLWGYRPTLEHLRWNWPESQYLYLLIRSGIVSLLAHLAWIGLTLSWLRGVIRTPITLVRSLAISTFAILVVLSIMGVTNEVFTYSGVIDYVWIMLGLVLSSEAYSR
jgi:hypothetical protein